MEKCNENGLVLINSIDDEAIPMLVNGHRLKVYKKPLSKWEFIEDMNKTLMVVEHVLASTLPTQWIKIKKKQKNKDSSESLHEALESHHWVGNLFWGGPVMSK